MLCGRTRRLRGRHLLFLRMFEKSAGDFVIRPLRGWNVEQRERQRLVEARRELIRQCHFRDNKVGGYLNTPAITKDQRIGGGD